MAMAKEAAVARIADGSFGAGVNGSYKAPGETSTTSYPGGPMTPDPVGIQEGLSAREGFDSEEHGPEYNYTRDSLTGNATSRPDPYTADPAGVKSKGKSFDIV